MSNPSIPQSNQNIPTSQHHLLSLKVLRAARPTFKQPPLHPTINPINPSNSISTITFESAPKSSTLTLPDSFGVIYLGQTFHGLLSVQYEGNQLDSIVENVALKVELHTASHKAFLDEIKTHQIGFGQNGLELSVKHEIKELGLHTLVCTVFYDQIQSVNSQDLDPTNPSPDPTVRVPRSFRKVYKFQVLNPLSVKTKVLVPSSAQPSFQTSPLPSTINAIFSPTIREQLYLEVQIQNQSTQPIIFQHVKLIPPQAETNPEEEAEEDKLEYLDLNLDSKTNLLSNSLTHLSTNDSNQFLFLIISQSVNPSSLKKPIQILGRLEISWNSMMGESGRLMTNPLTRKRLPGPIPSIPNWKPEETRFNRFESIKFDLLIESLNESSNIKVGIPFKVIYLINLSSLPILENPSSWVLVFQHLSIDDDHSSIEVDQTPTNLSNVSSNPDWSLKESLVSFSSNLLSNTSTKRSSTIETKSPNKSTWNDPPQKPNRWTLNGNFKPNSLTTDLSTPRPLIRKDQIRSDQVGMVRLGPDQVRVSEIGLENRVSVEYLALEDGLKALGGIRLVLEELNDDTEERSRRSVVVGEWNETGYVWCKL
ncbi:uncharacterized protein MELLADRAFT_94429 [Melampsora larici-populina 98AG31]|uniref:DUF974-domain-containing protein n=1 Tax=Melampsora larici-populina (strain 98AG31 / pathotype 3-4-7) TaxID=747676 RepID=F4RBH2_MELLP|nr:uncharacterized protein MELLADRAFT_94429 [Melampsora larici-populina 98AG31]EGG10361.1 hypothetical protein MELLADRAFT_94429 [Melampsora larici-populina 98AG31]